VGIQAGKTFHQEKLVAHFAKTLRSPRKKVGADLLGRRLVHGSGVS